MKKEYMNFIKFQNKQYQVRELKLPEIGVILISTVSLNNKLLNNESKYISDEAIFVDESIFYYVEENQIQLSDEEIINLLNLEIIC